ncbi:hypothetical protein [Maridesulfovibrio sp.]|uniref:hypothetical protein n=1 Tax=unclassified Maridesulfovibrio TaxID=2794999 RepID=UPI003AFFE650
MTYSYKLLSNIDYSGLDIRLPHLRKYRIAAGCITNKKEQTEESVCSLIAMGLLGLKLSSSEW